ncbi:beta-1,4-galactosyltransferase 3-like [Gastrophryne carolinensis]
MEEKVVEREDGGTVVERKDGDKESKSLQRYLPSIFLKKRKSLQRYFLSIFLEKKEKSTEISSINLLEKKEKSTEISSVNLLKKGKVRKLGILACIYLEGQQMFANFFSSSIKSMVMKQILPTCPEKSPYLRGPVRVHFPEKLTMEEVMRSNPYVTKGGHYKPPDCESVNKTAIIIPYRNREHHLKYLLYHLHPFMQRQQLNYAIYVINQAGNTTFNRGKLMNIGFREAMKDEDWDCIFFHDVDLIPEDDRNLYTCNIFSPKHVSVAVDRFGYILPYDTIFGGISAFTPEQYVKANGFPNNYWGWGGEDDDLRSRVLLSNMTIVRPPALYGRYKMLKHTRDEGNEVNPLRFKQLKKTKQMWSQNGMNSLQYNFLSKELLPLCTYITVDIGSEKGSKTRH